MKLRDQEASKPKQPEVAMPSGKVFDRLRVRIATLLERCTDIDMRSVGSPLEYAIGTFAPSEMMKAFRISDYPFIGSRYVSLRDGHVYIVAGATDDGQQIIAYRLGFWRSGLTSRGGIAVAVTDDAWIDSVMILFSLYHAGFDMNAKRELVQVHDELSTRRSFPVKKLRAYFCYLKRRFGLLQPAGEQSKPAK